MSAQQGTAFNHAICDFNTGGVVCLTSSPLQLVGEEHISPERAPSMCRDLDTAMAAAALGAEETEEAAGVAGDSREDAMDETEAAPVSSEQAQTRCGCLQGVVVVNVFWPEHVSTHGAGRMY